MISKKHGFLHVCTFFLVLSLSLSVSKSYSQLQVGDIAFLHMNIDPPDDFSWVALVDIPAGTQIFFTEDGWDGSAFYGTVTEVHLVWTAPAGGITRGTVVSISESAADVFTASSGTAVLTSGANWELSISQDVILAYTGSDQNPTLFIAGICSEYNAADYNATTSWPTGASLNVSSSALPASLTNGVNAIAVFNASNTTEFDNLSYLCTVTTGTKTELLAAINNYNNWGNYSNTVTTSACAASFTVNDPLPLTLLHFSGTATANNNVQLTWTTTDEVNTHRFEVQWSEDGANWEKAATLASMNRPGNHRYSTTQALMADNNYFRLKMIDIDETYTYSKILHIKAASSIHVRVYPNPADKVVSILLPGTKTASIRITGINGQLMKQQQITGQRLVEIDISRLPKGIYNLAIVQGETIFNKKLIKK